MKHAKTTFLGLALAASVLAPMQDANAGDATRASHGGKVAAAMALLMPTAAIAADRAALEKEARTAYQKLLAQVPAAKALSKHTVAVLVFPRLTKAGFIVGGQYGDGVLFRGGTVDGFYNTTGASYGLQAGAQQYGYAMLIMNQKSLNALNNNDGFEVGIGPSIVVVDEGMGKSITTTTATNDIYAFIFGQKGLMAGLGLQGNKITRLNE